MIAVPTFLNAKAGLAVRYSSGHPLGDNIEFHGLTPAPDDLDLSWHDERFVMKAAFSTETPVLMLMLPEFQVLMSC